MEEDRPEVVGLAEAGQAEAARLRAGEDVEAHRPVGVGDRVRLGEPDQAHRVVGVDAEGPDRPRGARVRADDGARLGREVGVDLKLHVRSRVARLGRRPHRDRVAGDAVGAQGGRQRGLRPALRHLDLELQAAVELEVDRGGVLLVGAARG